MPNYRWAWARSLYLNTWNSPGDQNCNLKPDPHFVTHSSPKWTKTQPQTQPSHSLSCRSPTPKACRSGFLLSLEFWPSHCAWLLVPSVSLASHSQCPTGGPLHPTPELDVAAQPWITDSRWRCPCGVSQHAPICPSSHGIPSTVTKHCLLPALAGYSCSSWPKQEAQSGFNHACKPNIDSNHQFCAKAAESGLVFKDTTSRVGKPPTLFMSLYRSGRVPFLPYSSVH